MNLKQINYRRALAIAKTELAKRVRELGDNMGAAVKVYQDAAGIPPGSPWCAALVLFCLDRAGGCPWKGIIKDDGYVPEIEQWGKANYVLKPKCSGYKPKPGDLILFGAGAEAQHIGIVSGYANGMISTIEGNTGDPSGSGQEGLFAKQHPIDSDWVRSFVAWPINSLS